MVRKLLVENSEKNLEQQQLEHIFELAFVSESVINCLIHNLIIKQRVVVILCLFRYVC